MSFDVPALMQELFPAAKPGEWVAVEYGLPREFQMVVFAVDDESTSGLLYLGYREGPQFRVMYNDPSIEPFSIGGVDGVAFWTLVPDNRELFAGLPQA